MSERRWAEGAFSALLVIVVASLLPFVSATTASAQPAGGPSMVRLAHLSPDTPPVDIRAVPPPGAEQIEVDDVGYGTVSDYLPVQPGSWRIEFRPAGFAADSPPVQSIVVQAEPGRSYTVAASGPQADLQLHVLRDESPVTAQGAARVRLFGAALHEVEVAAPWAPGTTTVAAGALGEYTDVPAGPITGTVSAPGVAPADLSGTVRAGCTYTGVIQERSDQLSVDLVQDACGLAATPSGPVPAGFGGSYPAGGETGSVLAVVVGAGLLAGGLVLRRRISATR